MKALSNNTECSGHLRFLSYFILAACLIDNAWYHYVLRLLFTLGAIDWSLRSKAG